MGLAISGIVGSFVCILSLLCSFGCAAVRIRFCVCIGVVISGGCSGSRLFARVFGSFRGRGSGGG